MERSLFTGLLFNDYNRLMYTEWRVWKQKIIQEGQRKNEKKTNKEDVHKFIGGRQW